MQLHKCTGAAAPETFNFISAGVQTQAVKRNKKTTRLRGPTQNQRTNIKYCKEKAHMLGLLRVPCRGKFTDDENDDNDKNDENEENHDDGSDDGSDDDADDDDDDATDEGFTETIFTRRKPLHTEAFAHKPFWTEALRHRRSIRK